MTKKFILDTLLPYKEDRENCGYDSATGCCVYRSEDGKSCAVGKHMKDGKHLKSSNSIECILRISSYEKVFKKEALEQNIPVEVWMAMQRYHDRIAEEGLVSQINMAVEILEKETGFKFPELLFHE